MGKSRKLLRINTPRGSGLHLSFLRSLFLISVTFLLTLLAITTPAFTAQIRVAWDPNTEPTLAGYRVYWGTASGSYGTPTDAGNSTSYTITGLTAGQAYYLAVKAYDSSNNESGFSNEVSGTAADQVATAYTYSFVTNPSGMQIVVDGTTYTAPCTFNWQAGSIHTLFTSSPQGSTSDTRYIFSSWSNGGAQSQTITVPAANTTYTADFTTQYSLSTSANPSNGGTVSPAATDWYNSGQNVTVTASPASGYSFSGWSGSLTGTANPAVLTMNGPKSVTAGFSAFSAPGTFAVAPTTGLNASGVQGGPFNPSSAAFILENSGGSPVSWTASKTQNWLTLSASSGTLAAGASVTVTVSINGNAGKLAAGSYTDTLTFTNTTNGTGNATRSISLTVSGNSPGYTISTNPSGLQVVVDGVSYTSPKTFTWAAGTTHTISVASPLGGAAGIRQVFSSWSDGGAQSHKIKASAEILNYIADFATQYSLTASSSPVNAGGTNPAGTTWHAKGQTFTVQASPDSGYVFSGWNGDLQGLTNPQSISMDGPKSVIANFAQAGGQAIGKIHPSVGVFRTGAWYFDSNGNGGWDGCEVDICVSSFGGFRDDIPVVGDWVGNGLVNIGVYRNGQWYLDADGNGVLDDCSQDKCVKEFGGSRGDIPVSGDWTGDGKSKIGIYRNGQWFLDKNNNGIWEGCEADVCIDAFGGLRDDIPVIGDWDQSGKDKIGVYRNGQWFLDLNGNGKWEGCEVDACIDAFGGLRGDIPVIGDWNQSGKDKIGVYRNGQWFLDLNGNGTWEGCEVDFCSPPFGGGRGDKPIVARHPPMP